MAKYIFLALCLLFAVMLSAQQSITNSLTDKHKSISRTKISLIPPKGFDKASNFLGFQQDQSGSTIMILDIPGPFSEASRGLTKEGFLSQGVEVQNIEKLTLNNLPAIFVTAKQNAYGNIYTKFIFAFGNEKETIFINGASPGNLTEIGKEIKASILTAFFESGKEINPFETVDFEINTAKSNLKFAKSMANMLLYNTDGIVPTLSADKTSLVVGKSFSKIPVEDKKLFSLNRIKKMPNGVESIETTNEITIDGVSGYEIFATGKDRKTGEKEKIYQVILFSDSLYYILYATTNKEDEKTMNELKSIVRTFKRK